jgi:hypothetical protein
MEGCLCCGYTLLRGETTVISPFLAKKAWGGKPEPTRVMFCANCGFRFFERGLTPEEATSYYAGYRDDAYLEKEITSSPFIRKRSTWASIIGYDQKAAGWLSRKLWS